MILFLIGSLFFVWGFALSRAAQWSREQAGRPAEIRRRLELLVIAWSLVALVAAALIVVAVGEVSGT